MESNNNENLDKPVSSTNNESGTSETGSGEELAVLKSKLEKAEKEVLYAKAEFENTRKRLLKEQDQAIKYANKTLITEILNVADYFERAVQHSKALKSKADAEVANFISGVEMTQHELIQLLNRFGVEFVGQVGETFDPEKHEAVGQKETDSQGVDKVLEVHQKGSFLLGRLVKPAKVTVGKEKIN